MAIISPKIITIPAQPGFDLVLLSDGADSKHFDYYPIIAWAIENQGNDKGEYSSSVVYPICADWNCNTNSCNNIIRRPDGTIEIGDGPLFRKEQVREALECAKKLARANLLRSA